MMMRHGVVRASLCFKYSPFACFTIWEEGRSWEGEYFHLACVDGGGKSVCKAHTTRKGHLLYGMTASVDPEMKGKINTQKEFAEDS